YQRHSVSLFRRFEIFKLCSHLKFGYQNMLIYLVFQIKIFWKNIVSFTNRILGKEQPSPDDEQE
ncbi:MAG: hypothetical protein U9R60_13205, partial [Bacteroidota bacterium]|nr:hypothetical protein [Bacteroidota bacterium]